jgi:hypothetical protein
MHDCELECIVLPLKRVHLGFDCHLRFDQVTRYGDFDDEIT